MVFSVRRPATRALTLTAALLLLAAPSPALATGSGASASTGATGEVTTSAAVGRGNLTPQLRAEIDRVVDAGRSLGRLEAGRASSIARCATFEGQRYCLGVGWTTRTERQVARDLMRASRVSPGDREHTGDLAAAAALRRTARLHPRARARAERRELTQAARSVAKVWLVRHEIQGVPLPDGFARRHPEARLATVHARSGKSAADYPERSTILWKRKTRAQNRYYWCGPAAMQTIAWGWKKRRDQRVWARRLGTTTAGTAITDMVRVVNGSTGYDRNRYAGPYITLDIGDFSFDEWYLLMMRHIEDYRAPVVMHPVLEKRFFPYLDDDASGHFQVGRGFDQNPGGNPRIGYFEPWDQSKFDPSEPRIARKQWRSAYRSYRANQAHFQHNVGV